MRSKNETSAARELMLALKDDVKDVKVELKPKIKTTKRKVKK